MEEELSERVPETYTLRNQLREKYKNQEEVRVIGASYMYFKGKYGDVTTTHEGAIFSNLHEENDDGIYNEHNQQ